MAEYSREWYESITPESTEAAELVWNWVRDLFAFESVVDVGCGEGVWLIDPLKNEKDVLGIDGEYVLDHIKIPSENFQAVDLSKRFHIDRKFDLCLCLEVAEHLPESSAAGFVEDLVQLSNLIIFSAAAPLQGGNGHINERWPSYWIDKFAKLGFEPSGYLRFKIWKTPQIAYWYRQNIIMFANEVELGKENVRGIWNDPRSEFLFPVIHPVLWGQKQGISFDGI